MALAVIGPGGIKAVTVHTWTAEAFIDIDTFPTHVLLESHVTFAAVAGWCRDAASVQAQVGVVFTHVRGLIQGGRTNPWPSPGKASETWPNPTRADAIRPDPARSNPTRVNSTIVETTRPNPTGTKAVGSNSTGKSWKSDARVSRSEGKALDAKSAIFIRASDRTHLWGMACRPAPPRVAATLHLGVMPMQVSCTPAAQQAGEAGARSLVNTPGAIQAGAVAAWTGADVAPCGIRTLSTVTHPRDCAALINIFTLLGMITLFVPSGAFTFVGSHGVDAVSSLAQARDCLTFIHILTSPAADIGDEPSATRMGLCWTYLARVTPGAANGGTTQGFGAHNAAQLPLAHLVVDLREAWSRSVISLTLWPRKPVHARTATWSNAASSVLAAIFTHGLPAVSSRESLLAKTAVVRAGATVHTSDVALLNGARSTTGRQLAVGARAYIWSGAETIATSVPTNGHNTLVAAGQCFPSGTTVGMKSRSTHIGPSQVVLASSPDPRL